MSNSQPSMLRHRANRLRLHADRIERTPAMSLERFATVDTWRGPRPSDCLQLLHAAQQRVHAAAEQLRQHAWQLERRADDLDAIARSLQVNG